MSLFNIEPIVLLYVGSILVGVVLDYVLFQLLDHLTHGGFAFNGHARGWEGRYLRILFIPIIGTTTAAYLFMWTVIALGCLLFRPKWTLAELRRLFPSPLYEIRFDDDEKKLQISLIEKSNQDDAS